MRVAALLLAAGRGERLGSSIPKAFVPLAGKPLLLHAAERLARVPEIDCVLPVLAEAAGLHAAHWRADLLRVPKVVAPVAGGERRQDSVCRGLAALAPVFTWVVVHDAARPLLASALVTRVLEAAQKTGAAIAAVPLRDTLKIVREGTVVETPDRAECFAAQTPQVFRTQLLRDALQEAQVSGVTGTDDAQLVERLGVSVAVVPGDPRNLKITEASDLAVAGLWLRAAMIAEEVA